MSDPTTPTSAPPQPPAQPPEAPRAGHGMRIALVVSLTVNLLVLGVLVGGAIGIARHEPRPAISDITLGTFTEALSAEDREALRVAAEAESLGLREMHRASREDYLALIEAVRAEPWDEAAARRAITAYGVRSKERIDAGERLMLERLADMGPLARRAFADRLEDALRRGFRAERTSPMTPPQPQMQQQQRNN
ncbi:periplasmic heavy metal sensor [Phaeovulum sp.]|uniref:periplasmic heavy metal sensor n=1 Tax=Phaeovulum sp. TaxID=2934796 RepID=UPI00356B08CF